MEKTAIETQVLQLQQKIEKLIKVHQQAKNELQEANIERKQLRAINEKQKEELKNFQNKIKMSKIVASIATEARPAEAISQRIDELVEEIDKCIAQLSQQ